MGILPNITAHAGCEDTASGSISSVYDGLRLRADFVEVDVRRTQQGELVLSHDRLTDENYRSCVRLPQVLELVKGFKTVGVNCDIKEEDILYDVLDLSKRIGLEHDQIVLSGSVTPSALKSDPSIVKRANVLLNIEEILKELCMSRLPAHAADIAALPPWEVVRRYIPDVSAYFDDVVNICLRSEVRAVNMPYRPPISEFLPRFREAGVPVSVWTVDKPEDIESILREGVYNITTRKVRLVLEARKNYAAQEK